MNKINIKRIALLCVGLISLVVYIIFSVILNGYGFDYTNEYMLYKDIADMSSLEDVEYYLDTKNIQYEIDENILTLSDYDDIEYVILPDNISGYILHSNLHYNLSRLDERDLDIVTIEKELINNKITEKAYLTDNGLTYTKIENRYYIEPTIIYEFIVVISYLSSIIILFFVTIEYIGVFFDWLKERRDAKNLAANQAENSNKETTKS